MDNEKILTVTNLSKSYGEVHALDKINFSLHPGIYALLGHNGAGKTTLLSILATVLDADSGEFRYNQEIVNNDKTNYRKCLGYMPQHQQLPTYLSVESFLYYMASLKSMTRKDATAKIESILSEVNLLKFRKRALSTLSGGMKQRLLIGQALLNDPEILLLDEPTAGLDPVERRSFRELIARISEHKIVILATHVISDVEWIANEIMIMKNGRILTMSSQADLIDKTHVYESFETIDDLRQKDPELKIVNQIRIHNLIKTRFISKFTFDNKVSTSLDDAYLDWLD